MNLNQLTFTATQVLKSLNYKKYQFVKSQNSKCIMVFLSLLNSKKEIPENVKKELFNKGILILGEPRFIISENGVWRVLFTIYSKEDLISVKKEQAEIEKKSNKRRNSVKRKYR